MYLLANLYNYVEAKPRLTCGNLFDWKTPFNNMTQEAKLALFENIQFSPFPLMCPRTKVDIISDNQIKVENNPQPWV